MTDDDIPMAVVIEEGALSVDELASACSVTTQWVMRHVEEGAIVRTEPLPQQWRFGSRDLARARRIRAIERDFDAGPELAALVADMLDEIDTLRARLRQAGLG